MATNYPTSLDTTAELDTTIAATDTLDSPSHSDQHENVNGAVIAVETKLGIGASNAASAQEATPLVHTGTGTSQWQAMSSDGGQDVILYSTETGENLTWDASASSLTITGKDTLLAFDVADGFARFAEAIQANGGVTGDLTGNVTGNLTGTVLTASQTNITGVGTITTGTWTATDVAVAHGGTGASTASDARTNLGLAIGTDVQAYSANLNAIAGLAVTNSNFIVGNGSTWVAESGATVRTSLGLGTGDSPTFSSLTVTNDITTNLKLKCDSVQWNDNGGGSGQNRIYDSGGTSLFGIWESGGSTHMEVSRGLPTLGATSDIGITTTGSNQIGIVSSSERFKHSITAATSEELNDIIDGLEVDFFRWNDDILENSGLPLDSPPELGMIAEKVAAAFPSAAAYDENNAPLTWQKAPIVSLCVGLLKEHKDQLAAMETRLAALEV